MDVHLFSTIPKFVQPGWELRPAPASFVLFFASLALFCLVLIGFSSYLSFVFLVVSCLFFVLLVCFAFSSFF